MKFVAGASRSSIKPRLRRDAAVILVAGASRSSINQNCGETPQPQPQSGSPQRIDRNRNRHRCWNKLDASKVRTSLQLLALSKATIRI